MEINLKRVYDGASPEDGVRVLVDRLWPRGVSRERAGLDHWAKEVAPSPDLRSAWHADPEAHDPEHFRAFCDDYRAELQSGTQREALDELASLVRSAETLTLVYGAKDPEINHVVVLKEELLGRL